jgi:hypothetical protein
MYLDINDSDNYAASIFSVDAEEGSRIFFGNVNMHGVRTQNTRI